MKYRQIKTDFWEDGYISELTQKEKIFFLYLFTNEKVSMSGIYELTDRKIVYTIGATLQEIDKMKKKFQNDKKYAFYKGWVYIYNFSIHNKYSSARNIVDAFIREFNSIPAGILNYFFNILKVDYISPIENINIVTVMDKVMDKGVGGRVGATVEARPKYEDIDIEEVSRGIEKTKREAKNKE